MMMLLHLQLKTQTRAKVINSIFLNLFVSDNINKGKK
jgi:hypothetical protein